eukprot:SAG11_NODE_796_length_7130_cov_57.915375_2_plen_85_part_00
MYESVKSTRYSRFRFSLLGAQRVLPDLESPSTNSEVTDKLQKFSTTHKNSVRHIKTVKNEALVCVCVCVCVCVFAESCSLGTRV